MDGATLLCTSLAILFAASCAHVDPPPDLQRPILGDVREAAAAAPMTLRVVEVARLEKFSFWVERYGGFEVMSLPVYVFVLEHPTEGVVLIDAGYGRRTARDPTDYPGLWTSWFLGLSMDEGDAVADRLPEIGYAPEDVTAIVVTHLHSDHIGGAEDFPNATVYAGKPDADDWYPGGGFNLGPLEDLPLVGVDLEGAPPYGPFPGHLDLFGDGTVILLETHGHTDGHLSVLMRAGEHRVLFAGDVGWRREQIFPPTAKSFASCWLQEDDWERSVQAAHRVAAFKDAYPEVMVITGHDERDLARLPRWPNAWPAERPEARQMRAETSGREPTPDSDHGGGAAGRSHSREGD